MIKFHDNFLLVFYLIGFLLLVKSLISNNFGHLLKLYVSAVDKRLMSGISWLRFYY